MYYGNNTFVLHIFGNYEAYREGLAWLRSLTPGDMQQIRKITLSGKVDCCGLSEVFEQAFNISIDLCLHPRGCRGALQMVKQSAEMLDCLYVQQCDCGNHKAAFE